MESPSSSTSSPLLLLLCLLLLQPLATTRAAAPAAPQKAHKPQQQQHHVALPLRKQIVPHHSLARPPNTLRFHHNVTLTVTLAVGTPPQNVTMVLDTGSELSWLLCNTTTDVPSFKPLSSTTYSPVPCSSATCQSKSRDLPSPATCDAASCHVYVSYADGSASDGALATDVFLDTPTAFGCMTSAYSAAAGDPGAAGLLGMNRGSLSFVTQTATSRFAYCISDRDAAGVLLLGGASARPLNYTPMVQISLPLPYFDRVAYSVQLAGIRVGGSRLPIPKNVLVPDHTGAGQTMVDSGSQFTFLLGPAYTALQNEFLNQTKGRLVPLDEPDFVFQGAFDTCFKLPAAPPRGLPEVVLEFQGAEVAVSGERLLYRVAGETRGGGYGVWCLTFGNSDLVPIESYIIGHHHQQNLWVEYDLQNSRVGFAPVQCDLASQQLGLVL